MGIAGIGYGGFDRYAMTGYTSVPNRTQAGSTETVAPAGGAGAAGAARQGASDAASAEGIYGTADLGALKRMGAVECRTCKSRTYQDGSNDPGVSFKAPGHIDPASSRAVVMSHEQEHVANEQAKAASEGRSVISQSVRLFTSVCPECGRVYVSGGETRTVTAADNRKNQTASPYKSAGNAAGRLFNRTV